MMSAPTSVETQPIPELGTGVTIRIGSDSYAATIIAISASGHRIELQHDRVVATKKAAEMGMTDQHKPFLYVPDPDGRVVTATRRRDGRYRLKGCKGYGLITIGERSYYQDPSF